MGTGYNTGHIDKLVDGKWEFVSRTYISGYDTLEGGNDKYFSLSWDGDSKYGKHGNAFAFYAPIFDSPGEYRFTINFREVQKHTGKSSFKWIADDTQAHSISFRYTVPEITDKPFDVLDASAFILNNELNHNRHIATVVLRLNNGTPAPYVLRDGKYCPTAYEKSHFSNEVIPDWDGNTIVKYYLVSSEDYADECTETFHFAEHSDGSGEQYDLTLNLRFK